MNVPGRIVALLLLLSVSGAYADSAQPLPTGSSQFTFRGWAGPAIEVRTYVPEAVTDATPIVIVMHGASRDVERYFADWSAQGEQHGFVVVVPEFSVDDFPGSGRYNLGNVFDVESGKLRPESQWTFSAIEPLFEQIVTSLGTYQAGYTIYGHSAGAQFVHRYLYYKPEARVMRAIVANAGWYTLPMFGVEYPYGLDGSKIKESVIRETFGKDVILLLGDADIDPSQENLRQTPEARRQGPHRYARGIMMFSVAKSKAEEFGVDFNWQLIKVHDAEHSNAQMTPTAAGLVK